MPAWLSRNRMIVASGVFAALLPLLTFLGDLGFLSAMGFSALGGGGVYLTLSREIGDVDLDESNLDAGQRETARQILSEALADVARLERAAKRIRSGSTSKQAAHLVALFNKTITDVTRDPERLGSVRRLLTFYAPRAADIAEAYVSIENGPLPDRARLDRAEASLRKIDEAWAHFADKLAAPDKTNLDIELDLLDQSLKTDLEKLPWR
jgi:5-bromo-4-chloroindolyl phosphate hydrolysis protein